MKALTLHQPWASLAAMGVKTIETRSWSTKYRGPLAIHAAKRQPDQGSRVGDYLVGWEYAVPSHPVLVHHPSGTPWPPRDAAGNFYHPIPSTDLPLGDVVAVCELVDVVPILHHYEALTESWMPHVAETPGQRVLWHWKGSDGGYHANPGWATEDIESQRSYGDFTPGRFAWILRDVLPLADPVAAKGKQGLWEWTA